MRYRSRARGQHRRRNPEADYIVTFRGGTTRPVWEISPSQYLAAIGVHQPWIMEISPLQYSRMSKRAKAQYDEKRRGEWQASADAAEQWRQLVMRAYAEGSFTTKTPGVSREARDVIWSMEAARSEALRAEERRKVSAANSVEGVPEGAIIYDRMWRRYARLLKRLKAGGLKVEYVDGNTAKKADHFFNILSDEDVTAEGLTSSSSQAEFLQAARSRWKGSLPAPEPPKLPRPSRPVATRPSPLPAPAPAARHSLWVIRVHPTGAPSIHADEGVAIRAAKHLGSYGSVYAHARNYGAFDLSGPGASSDDLKKVVLTLDPEAQVRKLKGGIRVLPPEKVLATYKALEEFWQEMARRDIPHRDMMIAMINHPTYRALPAERRAG